MTLPVPDDIGADSPMGRKTLTAGLQVALATLALSAPTIYNGFPFVGYDTGDYLISGGTGQLSWAHSPLYSFFVFAVGGGWSLWNVVIVQSLIGAVLIRLTARMTGAPSSRFAQSASACD